MDLSGLPDPKKEYTQRFENLSGGLNHFYRTQLLCGSQRPAGSEKGVHAAF
nr:MAG TPA: hypothetical protein [Caudoviricetes sp.]